MDSSDVRDILHLVLIGFGGGGGVSEHPLPPFCISFCYNVLVAIYNDNDASPCFLLPFYTWYFKTMFTPLSIQLRFLCKKIYPHVILTSEKYLKDNYEVGFSYIILSL